jgi:hypothetical protein
MNDNPSLPSAKPSKATLLTISLLSIGMSLIGTGLGATAIFVYQYRAGDRVATENKITALEQNAQINQRKAQLQRSYDAPIWISNQTYDPTVTYTMDGTTQNTVPVLVGRELDTAVCIGTIGPDGFIQNINDPLCLGY